MQHLPALSQMPLATSLYCAIIFGNEHSNAVGTLPIPDVIAGTTHLQTGYIEQEAVTGDKMPVHTWGQTSFMTKHTNKAPLQSHNKWSQVVAQVLAELLNQLVRQPALPTQDLATPS